VMKLPKGNDKAGGGGGGGERNPIPASKGKLPKFSMTQLAPPTVVIQNLNPKMPVEPTVIVPPEIRVPQPNLPNMGDPLAAMVTNSSGPGFGGGIGTGGAGGVGSGNGPGVGPGDGGGIKSATFTVEGDYAYMPGGSVEPGADFGPGPMPLGNTAANYSAWSIQGLAQYYKVTYPIGLDATFKTGQYFDASVTPANFVIALRDMTLSGEPTKAMQLVELLTGAPTDARIRSEFDSLLANSQ
jgi:hypothetical protein